MKMFTFCFWIIGEHRSSWENKLKANLRYNFLSLCIFFSLLICLLSLFWPAPSDWRKVYYIWNQFVWVYSSSSSHLMEDQLQVRKAHEKVKERGEIGKSTHNSESHAHFFQMLNGWRTEVGLGFSRNHTFCENKIKL